MHESIWIVLSIVTSPLILLIVAVSPNFYMCFFITLLGTIAPFVFHKTILIAPAPGYILLYLCLGNILLESYNRSVNGMTLPERYFLFRIESLEYIQSFLHFFHISHLKKFDIFDSIEHENLSLSRLSTGSIGDMNTGFYYYILAPRQWLFATTKKYKYGWIDMFTFRLFNPNVKELFEHSPHLYVLFACCIEPIEFLPISSIRYFIGLSETSPQAVIIPEKYYSEALDQNIEIIGFSLSEGYTSSQLKELGYLKK